MLNLLLIGLAAFRVGRLVAFEAGPGDIFIKLRALAGAYDYGIAGLPVTSLGRGITCPYCVGTWAAMGLYLLSLYPFTSWIVVILAGAGVQTLLESSVALLDRTNSE